MRKGRPAAGWLILTVVLTFFFCTGAAADGPAFRSYDAALRYVKENRPAVLDVGQVRWQPADLLKLKETMGEGAALHFQTTWGNLTLTDESEEVDLNQVKRISADDLEAVILLCPKARKVTLTKHFYLRNKPVLALAEKYPGIEFVWQVTLGGRYRLPSDCTAYSSFNSPDTEASEKLRSEDLEALQYVHNLKALDLGHNDISSLDWLKYCPDLEFLILADNWRITDITPIGNLKHLQYLELFVTGAEDLSPLANCTELLDLNLSYDRKVTDLSPLDGLTKLERFWGNHMDGLAREEKDRFAAAHPDTRCVFDGIHNTSEGWREHERYDHYRWCLTNRTWIPFSEPLPGK